MTGDPIQAHVTKPLKGKDGRVAIPAGTIAQGRILRLVKYSYPFDVVELILSFDSLQLDGGTLGVHLSPPETSETESGTPQSPQTIHASRPFGAPSSPTFIQHHDEAQLNRAQADRKNGTGTFEFDHTHHIHLPAGHTTEWAIN
jgi:hypothetical protein